MTSSLNIENESVLFDLLKQGDQSAFEEIYRRYWVELYNTAYKRLREKEKCQDGLATYTSPICIPYSSIGNICK